MTTMTSEPSVLNTDAQYLKYGVLRIHPGSHYPLASCSRKTWSAAFRGLRLNGARAAIAKLRAKIELNWPLFRKTPWRSTWQPTPEVLPRESHGQRSLVDYSPKGLQRVRHNWSASQVRTTTVHQLSLLLETASLQDCRVPKQWHKTDAASVTERVDGFLLLPTLSIS